MSFELEDLQTMVSTLDKTRIRWENSLRLFALFTIVAFVIVWLVAKKGVDATDIQLLSAIVAVATVALLVGVGWVGYILGLFLGYVGIKIEKLAHVIAEKSSDNEGEYE